MGIRQRFPDAPQLVYRERTTRYTLGQYLLHSEVRQWTFTRPTPYNAAMVVERVILSHGLHASSFHLVRSGGPHQLDALPVGTHRFALSNIIYPALYPGVYRSVPRQACELLERAPSLFSSLIRLRVNAWLALALSHRGELLT